MENMCYPWGLPPPAYSFSHQQTRNRFGSTLDIRDTCPSTAQQNLLPRRRRSPSLPPILNYQQEEHQHMDNDNSAMKFLNKVKSKHGYEEGEGETSGYASDTVPQSSPESWKIDTTRNSNRSDHAFVNEEPRNRKPVPAWHQNTRRSQEEDRLKRWTKEEQRPRWGDRGVAAGRLWEPQDADARLPQVHSKGTPSWVERSLNMIDNGDSQILVIDQQSSHSSGGDTEYKNMSEAQDKNTFLLGQNVPIEPNIKAEREYRRLKALELQAAIVQQLEDRERQKKEEKEKRIKEEREEEERFRRQQELERQRLDDERRVIEEKQKREQKRAEALRQALERAEQQAKIEKENKKNRKLRENFDAMSLNSEADYFERYSEHSPKSEVLRQSSPRNAEAKLIQNVYLEQAFKKDNKMYCQGPSDSSMMMSNPQSARYDNISSDIPYDVSKNLETPRQNPPDSISAIVHNGQSINMMPDVPLSLVQIPISQEMFTPINFSNNNAVQMAFLVPQNISNVYPCIHQPISMQALYAVDPNQQKMNYQTQIETDETSKDRTNKLLTPSKYRNPNYRDASTQTDLETVSLKNIGIDSDKSARKSKLDDLETLEQNTSEEKLNSSTMRKEKRLNSEERALNKDLESRPKWGVNKPPTQYKKQSEKDIFYTQKRKLRQRKRTQDKQYTSHSSDDNRSPSPAKKSNEKTRVSLSDYHWRKKGLKPDKSLYSGNVTVETTQILPLECDQSGIIHIGEKLPFNQKRVYTEKKPPISRGMSLSTKFMNDKYGNPKLWQDSPLSEPKSKYEEDINMKDKLENRKKYVDSLNIAKRDHPNYYKDEESNQPIILDQLRSLRDSLKKQQQIWGKYDNNRRSPSPKNEVDLEME